MQQRRLGPFSVSALGFGCMNLSHAYGAPPAPEAAEALLLRVLDCGITFFDTAALYGFGVNETLLGRVLKPHRSKIVLASKGGMTGINGKRVQWTAFVIAGTVAGIGGALFAYLKGSVFPDSLGISLSVDALVMVLLGGVETVSGAVIGALLAQGKHAGQIKRLALELSWKRLGPLVDPSLPRTGLIKGRKVKNLVTLFIGGDIQFMEGKIPCACVAADRNTVEEVVSDHGSVPEALRARISLHGIFTVVNRDGRYLVDGTLVNPVPVSIVRRMGADFVIAVNVIPDVLERAHRLHKEQAGVFKEPNIISILMQSMYIGTYSLAKTSMAVADIVIEPEVAHIGAGEFRRAQELILQGELAAQDRIAEIKKKLGIVQKSIP